MRRLSTTECTYLPTSDFAPRFEAVLIPEAAGVM